MSVAGCLGGARDREMRSSAIRREPIPRWEPVARILIVEDDAMIAWDLNMSLQEAGFEVCGIAASSDSAIDLASVTRPDLVLMDVNLKGEADGIETAKSLRARGIEAPVIFVTGFGDAETASRIRSVDPAGYLLKPVLPDELVDLIHRVLDTAPD